MARLTGTNSQRWLRNSRTQSPSPGTLVVTSSTMVSISLKRSELPSLTTMPRNTKTLVSNAVRLLPTFSLDLPRSTRPFIFRTLSKRSKPSSTKASSTHLDTSSISTSSFCASIKRIRLLSSLMSLCKPSRRLSTIPLPRT